MMDAIVAPDSSKRIAICTVICDRYLPCYEAYLHCTGAPYLPQMLDSCVRKPDL